jgi:transposase-like protein
MLTIPPFCPNAACLYHFEDQIPKNRKSSWYQRDGTYTTKVRGTVQRFVCTHCGKRFSSQTFSLDYGVKRHVDYRQIFTHINSSSGIRTIARALHVSEQVIINRISRLARQAIGMHATLRTTFPLREPVTADGFESFTCSQYHPNNIHVAVGKESQYLYGIDYAHLRRKGRMTGRQKKRRSILEERWKAPAGDVIRSFRRLVRQIERYFRGSPGETIEVYTDEKQEYLQCTKTESWIVHRRISSALPRTLENELFAVNYYDREIRKDQSNHTRETVEYSRDTNNSMERMWVYCLYHNYLKPYRIDRKERRTHAECAGVPREAMKREWKTLFTRRYFVSKLDLTESERYAWFRCYASPMKWVTHWYPRYAAD